MGLERVAAVLQGVISNYDTDLFLPLMEQAANICDVNLEEEKRREQGKGGAASLRVIAIMLALRLFLISDGIERPMKDAATCYARLCVERCFMGDS